MSYQEFWLLSPKLVESYRQAEEHKQERENLNMWVQGLYFMQGLRTGLNEFGWSLGGGKGVKPTPTYPDYPIAITKREREEEKQRKIQKTLEWVAKGQENG